jgi:hypothetical protein
MIQTSETQHKIGGKMFQKNERVVNAQIQIVVDNLTLYPGLARNVFEAITDWSRETYCYCLHLDLLITNDILLASSAWNGIKTIIFLGDKDCPVKSGIIICDGTGLYDVIMSLLNET